MLERYASGRWLTPGLIMFSSLGMIAASVAAVGFLIVTSHGTLDYLGRPIGTDFSSFWTAGQMALEGQAKQAYDWIAHHEVQKALHGIDMYFPWSYPPVFLLAAAIFAMMPYGLALFVWQLASMAAAAVVLWEIIPNRRALLAGLGFPAVFVCVGHGQTGFLTAALLAGGLVLLPRKEILAGVLFGLLVYKPQFGLLLPFVLAVGGYWRAIAAAAVTGVVSVLVTLAIWGWPVWQAFFDSLPLTERVVLAGGSAGFEKFQSIFGWVRLVGGWLNAALASQSITTLAALAGCMWIWRTDVSYRLKCAALLVGTLLATPYVLDYDFIAFGLAIALFVAHGMETGFRRWEKTVLAVAWFIPVTARGLAQLTYVPTGFLALLVVFGLILLRAVAEQPDTADVRRPSDAQPERLAAA